MGINIKLWDNNIFDRHSMGWGVTIVHHSGLPLSFRLVNNNVELILKVLLVEVAIFAKFLQDGLWNEQRKTSMRARDVVQFILIIVYLCKIKPSLTGCSQKTGKQYRKRSHCLVVKETVLRTWLWLSSHHTVLDDSLSIMIGNNL